jgi:rod shape-determining protein MreC
LVRDGTPALATGRGDGTIELKTLEAGENPFKRGDVVVTSGVGGIYPPLVPVAVVVSAGRDVTVAHPLANPARIDFAIVQTIYQPAASKPVNANEQAQAGGGE